MTTLELAGGTLVTLGHRTAGGSKNETRYGVMADGREVVVKTQRNHGRLREEAAALTFLGARGVRAPKVIAAATGPDSSEVLVLSREAGERPVTPDGWRRFGRDLATLASVDTAGWPLATVSAAEFAGDHDRRLSVVAHLLDGELRREISAAIERVADVHDLVITHGDPGSGNYLDDGEQGTLIDWETASLSPFGLDIGRAVFIGLLDLGRTGIRRALVAALIDGYRANLTVELDDHVLRAWTIIAGLQFIHGRHVRPLRPDRTPQVAAEVLAAYLAG
ncbi:hypothetical protein GCM10022286_01910 [Gryllotalpicola daejeonensis]|uniref:Aminoglycoside phosphotransferase domain-containing protein n=1 Tax=Gryllotalpicola daejeonensis TaxID=993087 RepID=A0ABP7ZDL3_9MICO